jgi:hypothetical protein
MLSGRVDKVGGFGEGGDLTVHSLQSETTLLS